MGQKFLYNDHSTSLNTDTLKLTNVWQNWGYVWHCSDDSARQALDTVCTDSGEPIGDWDDIIIYVLELFQTNDDFRELFLELEGGYSVAEAEEIMGTYPSNKQAFVSELFNAWSVQGFNGTDKYFADDADTQLNEDAPPSPWVMAAGAGVVLAFAIKTVVSEYKKAKAKAIKDGKKIDTKKLILNALSAAANEVQRAKA